MQLVKIQHMRCSEWSDVSFVLAPDEWDEQTIDEKIYEAQTAYLNTLKLVRENRKPPNDYTPYGGPPYKQYPDKTVKAIQTEWEEKKAEYEAWAKKTQGKSRRFENFLRDLGFVSLWDDNNDAKEFEVDWGHRHGMSLAYGTPKTDPTKPVTAIDDDEWEDDDFA